MTEPKDDYSRNNEAGFASESDPAQELYTERPGQFVKEVTGAKEVLGEVLGTLEENVKDGLLPIKKQ